MRRGMTLIEVVLAVLILAFALIPIADHLGKSTTGTLEETSEADAMQFACDNMDQILMQMPFDQVQNFSETYFPIGRKTDALLSYQIFPLPLSSMAPFNVPRIVYHSPCYENDPINRGVEASPSSILDTKITEDRTLDYNQLDEEKFRGALASDTLAGGPGTLAELKDIRLTVRWRTKGAPDAAYNRHPIVLYSRKARL